MNKALFWDFDGTLVHADPTFYSALCAALEHHGFRIPDEAIRGILDEACPWKHPDADHTGAAGPTWWDAFFAHIARLYRAHGIDDVTARNLNRYFKERILDTATYRLYGDAKDTLVRCRELGYRNFILSNNFPELSSVAAVLGLAGCFEDCIVSGNVGYEKPRRELFEYALHRAGNPDICYMIGDSPASDIAGGSAVGMTTILVHGPQGAEADYRCDHLCEIPPLLGA